MTYIREGLVALTPDRELMVYWCQGCNHIHCVRVAGEGHAHWEWDGDVNSPTLSPSIREFYPTCPETKNEDGTVDRPARPESTQCHHFLKAGEIEFLSDCAAHEVRGKHPLQPIPADYGGVSQ